MNPSKNLDIVIIKVNQENGCIYGTHVCACVCVCDWPHTCACQTLRGADPALCLEITFVLIFTVTVNSQISF